MLHISSNRKPFNSPSPQEIALVLITMLWGVTFLIVHLAVRHSGPLFFVGVRFLVAGMLSLALFRKAMADLNRRELGAGIAIGLLISIGYGLQTYGLQTISSSKSAFITAMYVPIVPLLQWAVLRRRPRLMSWIGVLFAFVGLMLLAGPGASRIEGAGGEIATLISALAIAGEVILIGQFANGVDSRRVTVVQLIAAGFFSSVMMPVLGETIPAFSWAWAVPALGLGVASALIQLTMNWAQKAVSPTRATVIYAGEPVWAGVVGRVAGERLPGIAVVGAVLILIGVLVSELKPVRLWPRACEA